MPATILVVDDERNILLTLSQALQLEGYHVELASDAKVALDVLAARPRTVTVGTGGISRDAHSLDESYEPVDSWKGPQHTLLLLLSLTR